ncbi:MAG: YggS family pyridoxal phosphate-dependent enzyme [Magnetococcales bacterium]|nr:YggS family pyridoxal phosphate-dependent enzyme [Magnetococcales bacterium]
MAGIAENLAKIREQIRAAARRAHRDPATVRLVAVSKTQPVAAIREAMAAGQIIFGESRVQEIQEKKSLLPAQAGEWHMIGPLQRNKVKVAVTLFDLMHSVDSVALAEEIHQRVAGSPPLPVLVQINMGGEPQKKGLEPAQAEAAIRTMARFSGLAIRGLMTIPPWNPDPEMTRPFFRGLATLARTLNQLAIPGVSMSELSMGMSQDFAVAVEEGATLVRVGAALFGERQEPAP